MYTIVFNTLIENFILICYISSSLLFLWWMMSVIKQYKSKFKQMVLTFYIIMVMFGLTLYIGIYGLLESIKNKEDKS
jgi:uncharacterized protein with PQ loop repeat